MTAISFWRTWDPPGGHGDDPQWNEVFRSVLSDVTYKDGYGLLLAKDKKDPAGRWYFQVECRRPDSTKLGTSVVGRGGKAYLSSHMRVSELTRLVLGLFLAYEEHECREFFKWQGRAIFGPHLSSHALWEIAERVDYRDKGSQ